MKIYTRRGDEGETDLFGGKRVGKDHLRVEAYGAVDELNSTLGVALAAGCDDDVANLGRRMQASLFELGSYLASPDAGRRDKTGAAGPRQIDVDGLEEAIDRFEAELAPLRRFILPGGTPAAAAFHLARTVCRRAERAVVRLNREDALEPLPMRYLNRLSDLLFVLARLANHRAGVADVEWLGHTGG